MPAPFSLRRSTAWVVIAMSSATLWLPRVSQAQAVPPRVVSVCSGVALPRSVVTDIMTPVVTGIAGPTETRVNSILGVIQIIPLVGQVLPPLTLNATGLLTAAGTGQNITLNVLDVNGQVVGPNGACDNRSDTFSMTTPGGLSMGGNQITGLGNPGAVATAGEINSIAFGNLATTSAASVGAIAIGRGAAVTGASTGSIALGDGSAVGVANSLALGAGSTAARGAVSAYSALGLTAPQTSAGEVSFGTLGATRQLTHVAAGSAATDAVNVAQLQGVADQITSLADTSVRYTDVVTGRIVLSGATGATISNLRAGTLDATSSEAVNGAQLFATNTLVNTASTAITTLTTNITQGSIGPVRYSSALTPTVPGAGVISNNLTLVGLPGSTVTLHNLGSGTIGAGSTDAVNGGQMFSLASRLAAGFGGTSAYDAGTNLLSVGLTYQGTNYTSLQDVLNVLGAPAGVATPFLAVLSTGAAASATGADGVAVGPGAVVSASNSVALGAGSTATRGAQTGYAALGLTAPQTSAGEVSIGTAGATRQLTHVAAGTALTDAVNLGQLQGVSDRVTDLADTSVRYTDVAAGRIVLAGATGATISNLRAGDLSVTSTEAVNGAQLFSTNTQVATLSTAVAHNTTQVNDLRTTLNTLTISGPGSVSPYVSFNAAGGPASATGDGAVALGQDAEASAASSVALGSDSVASRGGQTAYVALGLSAPQTSAGEVSIGRAGAARQLTNVAAGSADTDAVNVAQLRGVSTRVDTLEQTTLRYDMPGSAFLTLAGSNGTRITNLSAARLTSGSTDAVNGAQLYATNQLVAANTAAIANLTNTIAGSGPGPVQYSHPSTPGVPNDGTPTDNLTLVGSSGGPVILGNVGNGRIGAGSTDAVNGGQVHQLATVAANAVTYDVDAQGNRTGGLTLGGATPVTLNNVAAGTVTATSTQAVNGSQLFATNQAVASARATADSALSLGMNSVQYSDADRSTIRLSNASGGPVRMSNLADGIAPSDAATMQQLNDGLRRAVTDAATYTDMRLAVVEFQMGSFRDEMNAGAAGSLAAAGLPQITEAGRGMMAVGFGSYEGQSAVAIGFSRSTPGGGAVIRGGATYDSTGRTGLNGGVGWRF